MDPLTAIRRRPQRYGWLWCKAPDDLRQLGRLVAWQAAIRGWSMAEISRAIQREAYRLGRDLGGFRREGYAVERTADAGPFCGVPTCPSAGVYHDPRFGMLCRRHAACLRQRRLRGGDPYLRPLRVAPLGHGVPARNKTFWVRVQAQTTKAEWETLWSWASRPSQFTRPDSLLESVRRRVLA